MGELARVIWRRKWRVLLAALAIAAVVYARSSTQPDTYQAESTLAATAASDVEGADARLAETAASLATTRTVSTLAAEGVDVSIGASELQERVMASADDEGFVTITAVGPSPAEAEALAAAVADALATTIREREEERRQQAVAPVQAELDDVERRIVSQDLRADSPLRPALNARYEAMAEALVRARLAPMPRLDVVSPARSSTTPVSPQPARDSLLTLAGALAIFALVALAAEALSDRLAADRPADDAARVTGLPVLAEIPRTGGPEVIEAFRTLRTGLMFMSTAERLRTLAIVSVDPACGKSFVALNLGREAAALEVPVLVVDGDLRRPSVHARLGLPASPGLSEALLADRPIDEHEHSFDEWLRVVTAGGPVADPAGLFGGRDFRSALSQMTWAELVVVDTPAASVFADAMAIASQCDATLVVVDASTTRRRALRRLVDGLQQLGAQPVGVVLNRADLGPRSSYYDRPRERGNRRRRDPAAAARPAPTAADAATR